MLFSMTGYGDARYQSDALQVAVDMRAVNNRYLKVTVRAADPYSRFEPEIEKVLRRTVRRGTVQVQLRVHREHQPHDFRLNLSALKSYWQQLRTVEKELKLDASAALGQILALPGVVEEPDVELTDEEGVWKIIEKVLNEAVGKFQTMRQEEGRAMGQELLLLRNQIAQELEQIRLRSPLVVESFRDKLLERVRNLLVGVDVEIDRKELIKEVSVYAERSDIAEEVVRLASHLDQFQEFLKEPESPGRKLEFLTQEMFREANTIGSKANDIEIARHVVEIKGAVEKIRELIQNIE